MGNLYLKNGQLKKAEENFLKGLDISLFREKDLNTIFRYIGDRIRRTQVLFKIAQLIE